jgi:hypothetical protein
LETGLNVLLIAPCSHLTKDPTGLPQTPQAFKEAPGIPWTRRTKGTSVVLMSLMELGVIEGFTDAKTDRSPQARRINACHCIPVNGGVFEVVGGQ